VHGTRLIAKCQWTPSILEIEVSLLVPMECDVVLKDGTTARLRPAGRLDADRLRAFFGRLSADSVNLRYFGVKGPDASDIDRLLAADPRDEFALIAECGGAIVALAQYAREAPASSRAEAAFLVADAMQGRGLGTRLLELLAEYARGEHIRTFHSWVMGVNYRMLHVFVDSGFTVRSKNEQGVIEVVLSLDETPAHESRSA
jgi:GNAT superfamily N-acetyltransferase